MVVADMKSFAVTTLLICALIALLGGLIAFLIALFPWSVFALGIPIITAVCIAMSKAGKI
jgi:hypothetical protein